MESTHSNLRIIADDLGLHKSINEGIIYLLKNGLIDGASIMASGDAFDDAIRQCLEVEHLNIGIHLVLVEERALTQIVLPKNHRIFFIKYILGLTSLEDIERELRAQLNKCIKVGIKPSFINSHQHLHLLPGITDIVIKLAKEYHVQYIRIVNEPFFSGSNLFRKSELLFLKLLSEMAKRKIKKAGLKCNDFFVGFINAGNIKKADVDFAMKLSRKFPDKVIELGCHPGYEDDELRKKYRNWGNYNWRKEFEVLKNYNR